MLKPSALVALLLLSPVPLPAQDISWASEFYDPAAEGGDPADLVLPMPCGGGFALQKVEVPVDGSSLLADRRLRLGSSDPAAGFTSYAHNAHLRGGFSAADEASSFFFLSRYELTKDQARAIVGDCPASPTPQGRVPALGLSWFEAVDLARRYTEWLREHAPEHLPSEGVAPGFLRLPTEAEWEYAARGGAAVNPAAFAAALYPMEGGIDAHAWHQSVSRGAARPVGVRSPNPLGLFDMYGNAEELILAPFKAIVAGRRHGQVGGLVTRGGSYLTAAEQMSSAKRKEWPMYGASDGRASAADTFGARFLLSVHLAVDDQRVTALDAAWNAIVNADPGEVTEQQDVRLKMEIEAFGSRINQALAPVPAEEKRAEEEARRRVELDAKEAARLRRERDKAILSLEEQVAALQIERDGALEESRLLASEATQLRADIDERDASLAEARAAREQSEMSEAEAAALLARALADIEARDVSLADALAALEQSEMSEAETAALLVRALADIEVRDVSLADALAALDQSEAAEAEAVASLALARAELGEARINAEADAVVIRELLAQADSARAELEAVRAEGLPRGRGDATSSLEDQVAALLIERERALEESQTLATLAQALAELGMARSGAVADAAVIRELRAQVDSARAELDAREAARLAEAATAQALREKLSNSEAEVTALLLRLEQERRNVQEMLVPLAAAGAAEDELNAGLAEAVSRPDNAEGLPRQAQKGDSSQMHQEASERIFTGAEEAETYATVNSMQPQPRPSRLASHAPNNTPPEPETVAALADADINSRQVAPRGPPLTSGEKEAFGLAVGQCWNVGSLSTSARETTVVVAFDMQRTGVPITDSIRMVDFANGSEADAGRAFEAARRAIIRCGAKGFELPVEKYDQWREMTATFNAEGMQFR